MTININLAKLTDKELESLRINLINMYESLSEFDSDSIKEEIDKALYEIYEEWQIRMYTVPSDDDYNSEVEIESVIEENLSRYF